MTNLPKPFVKWAGGKGNVLSQYDPHFPKTFNRYWEPFVGGGSVFFHLFRQGRIGDAGAVLGDTVEPLMSAYEAFKNNPEGLQRALPWFQDRVHDKEAYYDIRGWDRDPESYKDIPLIVRAARMLYLNRCSFNGLWRMNSKGQHNVPFGDYKSVNLLNVDNLQAVHKALQEVRLIRGDFNNVLQAEPGDLIYLDPPYYSKTTGFSTYSGRTFGKTDQVRVSRLAKTMTDRGVHVMASNTDHEYIRFLWNGFHIIEIQARRQISRDSETRGNVTELLLLSAGASVTDNFSNS